MELVREAIDAGRDFLAALGRTVAVELAYWLCTHDTDDDPVWRLHVIVANAETAAMAGRNALVRLHDPHLTSVDVRYAGPGLDQVVAADVRRFMGLYPGRAINWRDVHLARGRYPGLYIYPTEVAHQRHDEGGKTE